MSLTKFRVLVLKGCAAHPRHSHPGPHEQEYSVSGLVPTAPTPMPDQAAAAPEDHAPVA